MRREVVVYTRSGCGLCVRAERTAARVARRAQVRTVDVDSDPRLQRRFGLRVPVVTVDGTEVAEYQLDARTLRRALRRADRSALGGGRPSP